MTELKVICSIAGEMM